MRKIFWTLVILFVFNFLCCKSPADPGIEATLEEEAALKKADIRVTVEPNPIAYFNNNVYFKAIFEEYDGVAAELQKLWMLTYCDGTDYEYSRRSFGWMCPKTLRAKGRLELDFAFYAGWLCYRLDVQARFLDENGHEFDVRKRFSVK